MHELVLVLSDCYVSQETPDRQLPAGVTLTGLQQLARFGTRSKTPVQWRPWLSRWLTGSDAGATATVAAAAVPALRPSASGGWVATPMHLIVGMTSVHVDRRSLLRLDAADQQAIAADFQRVFHDSGFHLQPLEAGDFLMLGPAMAPADVEEPARAMGASLARQASVNPVLRKLGAEIEMWLHDHSINDARRRRGEQPVTALWLWGGGAIAAAGVGVHSRGAQARSPDMAFGRDSYLQGLWALQGGIVSPLPQQLEDVFSYPHAQRAALVIEIGVMLQSNPKWTFFEALVEIDRRFITPAVEALNAGRYNRLVVLANDNELTLRASDRFKFWRRTSAGLSGLQ